MTEIIGEGKYARFIRRDNWEYVERPDTSGVVVIVAVTEQDALIMVEQHRVPVGGPVIELPAGLAGDKEFTGEELEAAAARELEEETGYRAGRFDHLRRGPTSAGLIAEVVDLYYARDLVQVGPGGGDASEDITVHEIKLSEIGQWLSDIEAEGRLVDPKVYTALYFIARERGTISF